MSVEGQAAGGAPEFFKEVSLDDLGSAHYEPDFVIEKLLPARHVTLLSAHGGMGKSWLSLIWAAHAAAGHPWAGLSIEPCRVLFVSLEDEGELIKSRLRRIIDVYGLDENVVKQNLKILDGSVGEIALATECVDRIRVIRPTEAMERLRWHARNRRLIVIDNGSYGFSGNENDRRQVSAFMRSLANLAQKNNSAVLLLAHVSKATAQNRIQSEVYSGSTAWHNAARSRLVLTNRGRKGVLLTQQKLNLAEVAAPIGLEWKDGVLVPTSTRALHAQDERDELDAQRVLEAFKKLWLEGRDVPTARTGRANLGQILLPSLPRFSGRAGKRRLYAAVEELEESGQIERERYADRGRHSRERWVSGAPNV